MPSRIVPSRGRLQARASLVRTALAVLLCVVAAGCSSTTEAESARTKWASHQPAAYMFTMQRICFCGDTRPVVVSVRNGVVESRKYEDTRADVPSQLANAYPTVEGLFALIDDAVARKADMITAAYDPDRGFPVQVSIDYSTKVADDELTVEVRDFKP